MAEFTDREHYIPVRRADLVALLAATKGLSPADRDRFLQFCRLLSATLHFKYNSRLEELKDDYAPFDPDRDTQRLTPLLAEEKQTRLNDLFRAFGWLLERANFKHLSQSDLEPALKNASPWGLYMDVDFGAFEHLAIFARGDAKQKRSFRRLRNFYREEEATVEIYQRLVFILKMRKHPRLPKDVDVDSVYLKVFKGIPKQDIKMLLPGARIRLSGADRGKIGVPLVGGIGYLAWKLFGSVVMALYNVADDALNILANLGGSPATWWLAASGVAGYGYKSYYGYQQTKQRYHLTLTESLYYQNLDSNGGVLTRLLDEAEEQDGREAILAYFYLWCFAPEEGWPATALDDYIELALEGAAGVKVDFEIGDALAKLEAMGLATKAGDRYRAVPIDEALVRLDKAWDGFFTFAAGSPSTQGVGST